LPLHAQFELNFARRYDVRSGAHVRPVGIDGGFLSHESKCEQRDSGCHCGKS
jgi:hypothetical protein